MTSPSPPEVVVTHLRLTDFRNHAVLDIAPERARLVALSGPNGAGKTNILEALSLFSPGRGLRRAAQGDLARANGSGGWGVAADIVGALGEAHLGTGLDPAAGGEPARRRCRVDEANVPSAVAFADHVRLVWLTPAMDGLFMASPGERRRFLDRLVLAVDPGHGARVTAFERALRARNKLLQDDRWDTRWLTALEHEAAGLGIAVAQARIETVVHLNALITEARDDASLFPWAHLKLESGIAGDGTATEREDRFAARLHELRHRDRAAGRATEGPHTADLLVRHGPKDMPAHLSSTGEQKALLLGLVLAHARLVARMVRAKPLVLLDEVAAHLDPARRAALYEVLADMGAQAWLTGADLTLFGELGADAALFAIAPGSAERVR